MEWLWGAPDEGRVKRAKSVKFTSIDLDAAEPTGRAAGSGKEDYIVSLSSCTCPDFSITQSKGQSCPCKHILALAMKAGIVNENGNTPEQQRIADIETIRDILAMAYGYYYLFNEQKISDADYNQLKKRLEELTQ